MPKLEPLECVDVTREHFVNVHPAHQITIMLNRAPTDAELKALKSVVKGHVNAERNNDENR